MAHAAYYNHFPVVEVQQTFYQPPRIATLERWRAEAPQGFELTLKAWQIITHEPSSPTYCLSNNSSMAEDASRFLARAGS